MPTSSNNNKDLRESIREKLQSFESGSLRSKAISLLNTLGYSSDRTSPIADSEPQAFLDMLADLKIKVEINKDKALFDDWLTADILFQLTDEELSKNHNPAENNGVDASLESYAFFAIELEEGDYARGKLTAIARQLNQVFTVPVMVFIKYKDLLSQDLLSIAVVNRRYNKRDETKDVLGKVTIIRDISLSNPHRGHLDILQSFALSNLRKGDITIKNFDDLHAAWEKVLDIEQLNRKFYLELFDWFTRAVKEARFPTKQARTLSGEEHIIRLITRLLFIWFIKEKGLIANDLFVEEKIAKLIKGYDSNKGDFYYRVILQNLFFGTLNTEIDKREFSKEANVTHRNFSRYRYKSKMNDPDALLSLFNQTPFVNGGLFDCLDSEEGQRNGGYRIDCFSDFPAHYKGLSIPNRLFFDDKGLFPLLNHYKFTVEENTPIEQEVALDPELLGKVFENLLAAYNPETKDTARKQTGSYYTPREVVDYMIDEALVAILAERAFPKNDNKKTLQERLCCLLDYANESNDINELFKNEEKERIVEAIAAIKVLDPAVGSGAFPMSMLHKLTLVLQRLDPKNKRWKELQKARAKAKADAAFETKNQEERDKELLEISETFEYYSGNFGRKLYLIQSSIFGVDIQAVACQITKLRFFISLAIEQNPDPSADNFGIKPLPNLEMRFIAANTLLGVEDTKQRAMFQDQIDELKTKLSENREKYFHATTRQKKLACKHNDRELREKLSDALNSAGLPEDDAKKIALWDPYDQNTSAGWFDPNYMFGIASGFDMVIGNPPYVESRNSLLKNETKNLYLAQVLSDWKQTLPRGSDMLVYFLARTPRLLHDSGYGCLITQNAWLSTDYGKKFQNFSLGKFSFIKIIDTSARFFSDKYGPQINAVIAIFSKQEQKKVVYKTVNSHMKTTSEKVISAQDPMKWGHIVAMPKFFVDMLSDIRTFANNSITSTFGQGLNFPLDELDHPESEESVIVKDVSFVATSADGKIRSSLITRNRRARVPALIMPRGIGNRYYCTFNACKAFSYSNVELYFADNLWDSDLHYCLWAYLNSSLVWLFREATGRKNLGGGLLKAEATDMKILPIDFEFDFADQARIVFSEIKDRPPLPLEQELKTDEHLAIDQMVFNYFEYENMAKNVRDELLKQVNFRTNRLTL